MTAVYDFTNLTTVHHDSSAPAFQMAIKPWTFLDKWSSLLTNALAAAVSMFIVGFILLEFVYLSVYRGLVHLIIRVSCVKNKALFQFFRNSF